MLRDLRIEAEAPPGPFPEHIRPAPIARTLILGITIQTHILATTATRRGHSGFGFSFGFGWPGAVWGAFGYGYPYRYPYPYTYGYPSPYGYPYAEYPSSVYVRPAPNPPVVVERDQQQPPPYRADEQAGFGTLSVRVNPPDAVILIDGEVWDRSPGDSRFSIELTEGVHQIEIRKEGYGSYARTIDVYRGRVSTLNVGLTPRGAVQKPTSLVVVTQR